MLHAVIDVDRVMILVSIERHGLCLKSKSHRYCANMSAVKTDRQVPVCISWICMAQHADSRHPETAVAH